MKILHTSDWHLGKRLPPFSREEEQKAVLKEIAEIAKREAVDVVVVAGDVFDVSVPPASAEEMFYAAALELSRSALVVAVAGNHDDGERLKAPANVAKASGILLAGGFDCGGLRANGVEAKRGGVIYRKNGERLNIVPVPYVSEARRGDAPKEDFGAYVRGILADCAADVFGGGGFDLLVTHLFMLGGQTGKEERELGAAKILPPDVLPKCDYAALGHIHKPMKVAQNAFYSGSILNYSFDEKTGKEVIIVDTSAKEIRHVPLSSGLPLVTVRADSFESALSAVTLNADAYIKIVYDSAQPLSASQTAALTAAGKVAELEIVPHENRRERVLRAHRSAEELFTEYYGALYGGSLPDEELLKEFSLLTEEQK